MAVLRSGSSRSHISSGVSINLRREKWDRIILSETDSALLLYYRLSPNNRLLHYAWETKMPKFLRIVWEPYFVYDLAARSFQTMHSFELTYAEIDFCVRLLHFCAKIYLHILYDKKTITRDDFQMKKKNRDPTSLKKRKKKKSLALRILEPECWLCEIILWSKRAARVHSHVREESVSIYLTRAVATNKIAKILFYLSEKRDVVYNLRYNRFILFFGIFFSFSFFISFFLFFFFHSVVHFKLNSIPVLSLSSKSERKYLRNTVFVIWTFKFVPLFLRRRPYGTSPVLPRRLCFSLLTIPIYLLLKRQSFRS